MTTYVSAADIVPLADVLVENPSTHGRTGTVIAIPLSDLGIPVSAAEYARLGVWEDGIPVPCSIAVQTEDGPAILAQVDLAGGQARQLVAGLAAAGAGVARVEIQRTYAEISQKVGGHWEGREYKDGHFRNVTHTVTPPEHTDHSWYYRYEGPGWENEKVGYRIYLDWRNGTDIFGKKVAGMVLPQVGQDGFDSYHEPADWGMDILKVGDAMGIGGFGHWDGKKAVRVSKTDAMTCTITRNDGLVSAFRNTYLNWDYGKGVTNLSADFQIEAGTYLTDMVLTADSEGVNFVTGLPIHAGIEVFHGIATEGVADIPNSNWSYLATYGDQSLDGNKLGMVIFFQGNYFKGYETDDLNFMVRLRPRSGKVKYSFGALWQVSAPEAADREAFLKYLGETVDQLNKQVRVTIDPANRQAFLDQHDPRADPLFWGAALAESEVSRRGDSLSYGREDPEYGAAARWGYTTGLISQAVYQLGEYTGKSGLCDWGMNTVSSFINGDGSIATYRMEDYNIDQVNSGKMLLELLTLTGEPRYKKAVDLLLQQLKEHPRTSGGAFWHKKVYPWQVWLDGVYMAAPFLARAGVMFGEPEYLEEVLNEFRIVRSQLRDPVTGLYFHGWDESRQQSWCDPETGLSDEFWGRGLGWYAMAIVDCLDYFAPGTEGHDFLVGTLVELAEALVRFQDPETGTWWQVLNKGGQIGNYREASASSMFVYAMAKGINRGYLPASYKASVQKGFSGLVNEFVEVDPDARVSLRHVCQVAGLGLGRDGTYDYYLSEPIVKNDPKGAGPFIFAAIEVDKLVK